MGDGFHVRDGLYFRREADGSVRVKLGDREVTVDPSSWGSVLASVCSRGETYETWQEAVHFHVQDPA